MDDHDHASKFKGLVWLVFACFLGAFFAVGFSPLAHAIPWSWEKKLGQTLDFGTERECRYNIRADALLQQLVKRLYPLAPDDGKYSIDVTVVQDPAVNAYATLGGKIYINSGFLNQAESPEEVAGVLAHEIGHVHHRHIMQGMLKHLLTSQGVRMLFGDHSAAASWASDFMNMDFSRSQEAQADEDGLRRLQLAQVDNQGLKHFFERMQDHDPSSVYLSDHPLSRSRIDMIDSFANQDVTPVMPQSDWKVLKNFCNK